MTEETVEYQTKFEIASKKMFYCPHCGAMLGANEDGALHIGGLRIYHLGATSEVECVVCGKEIQWTGKPGVPRIGRLRDRH